MLLTIIFVILMIIGMIWVLRDDNAEVVAWKEGKYFKAIMLAIWYVIKVAIFFFFAPIICVLMFLR